ncbi:MAG TPA: Type 1 glutamine amidotransferase-like domain-containing protein [Thermomicrobiales bacterium]|nr:Type 1 glutamine amidotransferase-like domain-containing protein [Thermomicrobiales bacterium]
MKLYLSSYRIGSEPERLRELVGPGRRAAIIFNACDCFEQRLKFYEREEIDLADLGFEAEELDLRDYFGHPERLRLQLMTYDLLWVVGGNTFVLARAMNAAGFAAAAGDLVRNDQLTYAGYSAGVCVTGPDLDGIHLMDHPETVPKGYGESLPTTTLGWVPWRIVPHWQSDHPEAEAAEVGARYMEERSLAYRPLSDGHAIVIAVPGPTTSR